VSARMGGGTLGQLIDFDHYRRCRGIVREAHIAMLEEAARTIERICGKPEEPAGFGCMHEAVEWIGYPPYQYERCRMCKRVLKQVGK
jgi:hypothetical protein